MNYIAHLFFGLLITACSYVESMERSLAPHKPDVAKVHENTLKRGAFSSISDLAKAREYFRVTDHPERVVWLKLCTQAKKIFIPHLERERQFINLLKLERKSPDEARWAKIHPLLNGVSSYLNLEESLRERLSELLFTKVDETTQTIEEPDIDYPTWLALIQGEQNSKNLVVNLENSPEEEEVLASLIPSESHTTFAAKNAVSLVPTDLAVEDNGNNNELLMQPPLENTKPTNLDSCCQAKVIKKKKKKKKKKPQSSLLRTDHMTEQEIERRIRLTGSLWASISAGLPDDALALLQKNRGQILLSLPHPALRCNLLQGAITLNAPALVKELLNQGFDPNAPGFYIDKTTNEGYLTTALLSALIDCRLECLQLLLQAGAHPDIKIIRKQEKEQHEHSLCVVAYAESPEYTPLRRAKALTLLLKNGASTKCNHLRILLRHPLLGWLINLQEADQQALVPEYIEHVTQISIGNDTVTLVVKPEPFEASTAYKKLKELKGALIDKPNLEDQLCYLLHGSKFEEVKKFLAANPTINLNQGCLLFDQLTPLFFCIHINSTEMCAYLTEHGANVNYKTTRPLDKTSYELTPFIYALVLGNKDLIILLLKNGADPNKVLRQADGKYETPLDCIVNRYEAKEFTQELCSDLIRIMLLSGATAFGGKVRLANRATKDITAIDLTKEEDQKKVKDVLCSTLFKTIIYQDKTITILEN